MDDKENPMIPGASKDAVAWRLTAVENEVKGTKLEVGQLRREVLTKLDGIASGFATHKDIEVAKQQAELEHKAIYEKISDVEGDVLNLKKKDWVRNTLSAILGAVLAILVSYFFTNITR